MTTPAVSYRVQVLEPESDTWFEIGCMGSAERAIWTQQTLEYVEGEPTRLVAMERKSRHV